MLLTDFISLSLEEWRQAWKQRLIRARLRAAGVRVHPAAVLNFTASDYAFGPGTMIGAGSFISVDTDLNDTRYNGKLVVGRGVYIGELNNIRASSGTVTIGDYACISQMVTIVAANHQMKLGQTITSQPQARDKIGVTIGSDVWLGAGCTVLAGVTIGDGAVIGAGSVVSRDVPPNSVYAGVPAKFIKARG